MGGMVIKGVVNRLEISKTLHSSDNQLVSPENRGVQETARLCSTMVASSECPGREEAKYILELVAAAENTS
jgi:hypothetical protein